MNSSPEEVAGFTMTYGTVRKSRITPVSRMKEIGMYGLIASIVCLLVGLYFDIQNVNSYSSDIRFPIFAPIAGAAAGLMTFVWIVGIIDQRLIEIREELKVRE